MNEQIRLLAEQAFDKANDGTLSDIKIPKQFIEKFAHLVVKELCDMMQQTEDDVYALEPSERPTEYIQFLYDWRKRFKQHFGVE